MRCGVPASGKSTLCAGALRRLEQRNRGVLGCEAMVEAGLRARDFGALGNFLGAVVPGWRRDFLGLPRALNDWHRFVVAHPAFAALCHRWLAEADADAAWREAVHHSLLTSAFEFQLAGAVDKPVLMDEGFAQRFYSFSQFKRSALPNGPKVSAGGALSPRGDWRAPSDMSARIWLDEIDRNVPEA